MSSVTNVRYRRELIAALCSLLVVGCSTTPTASVPAPSGKEAVVAGLRSLGFVSTDEGWELSLGVKLLFDSNVDTLSGDGRAAVEDMAHSLKALGVERIRVEGHTDNVGTAKYNVGLSQRRADSVAQHLVKSGWSEDTIERRGFGADKPIADNATVSGRAQNRRVVIAVQVE